MNPEEKLALHEKMKNGIQTEYDSISVQMEKLKDAGKTKTVTYKTLLGKKMMYKNMLDLYKLYGIEE